MNCDINAHDGWVDVLLELFEYLRLLFNQIVPRLVSVKQNDCSWKILKDFSANSLFICLIVMFLQIAHFCLSSNIGPAAAVV